MTSTPEGNLFCPDCMGHLDVKNEPKRNCPVDGAEMQKEILVGLVLIDRCASCGGTWFDKDELDVIKKRAEDEAWNKGFFLGWVIG
jgi:hypothetical protein